MLYSRPNLFDLYSPRNDSQIYPEMIPVSFHDDLEMIPK